MSEISTKTNTTFIEAEAYSNYILQTLHEQTLTERFYRNVSDFDKGTTLHIKTIGDVTVQEAQEGKALVFSGIDSGEVTMTIDSYVGDAWAITEDMRIDGSQINSLLVARLDGSVRALNEEKETRFFRTCAEHYQTAADPFKVNGFPHLIVSAEVGNIATEDHFIAMKLAFDKAKVPFTGRIFICDPIVEATFNKKISFATDLTSFGEQVIKEGLSVGMKPWRINLFGFDVLVSNFLHKGAFDDGTTSIAEGVANIFMCIADDMCKPVMYALRRPPVLKHFPDTTGEDQDKFSVRKRDGFGLQRTDTLGCLVTSPTNYK